MEHVFERLQELNATKAEEAMIEEAKVKAVGEAGLPRSIQFPPP
jgi:hypothetical protein